VPAVGSGHGRAPRLERQHQSTARHEARRRCRCAAVADAAVADAAEERVLDRDHVPCQLPASCLPAACQLPASSVSMLAPAPSSAELLKPLPHPLFPAARDAGGGISVALQLGLHQLLPALRREHPRRPRLPLGGGGEGVLSGHHPDITHMSCNGSQVTTGPARPATSRGPQPATVCACVSYLSAHAHRALPPPALALLLCERRTFQQLPSSHPRPLLLRCRLRG
jgi:hypothetical protein